MIGNKKKYYNKHKSFLSGDIYYHTYYELTGKIEWITDVRSLNYIDKDENQKEMFYLIFKFISDDPTEKEKVIYYYGASEEHVLYPFNKIVEKSNFSFGFLKNCRVILYLEKRKKKNTRDLWRHPNDKCKYHPNESSDHGQRGFIFKNNLKNRILVKNQLSFKRYLFLIFLVLGIFFLTAFDYDDVIKAYTIFFIYLCVVNLCLFPKYGL